MGNALIKYHSGKSKLAKWIISKMPPHRLYVEPFGGGASILLTKSPAMSEVYNDLDGEVVNMFRMIRERGEELAALVYLTPFSRDEMDLAYEPTLDPLERARRFFIRAHMAITTTSINHKSGFRAAINSRDYCAQFFTWWKTPETILKVRDRLARVCVENCDAFSLFDRYDYPKTLWYMDPPYFNSTRSHKSVKRGYVHNLSDEDHHQLLTIANRLKGPVMISGYENELYTEMLKGWRKEYTYTHDDAKKKRKEVLWMNFQGGMQTCIKF